jgi:hypothetical protein
LIDDKFHEVQVACHLVFPVDRIMVPAPRVELGTY